MKYQNFDDITQALRLALGDDSFGRDAAWDSADDFDEFDDSDIFDGDFVGFDEFVEDGDFGEFDNFDQFDSIFDDFDNRGDEDDPEEAPKDETADLQRRGHRFRLRGRVSRDGLEEYTQHSLLELLLYYVLPRQDVKKVCDALLQRYGDLRALFRADLQELLCFPGLGENGARWIDQIGWAMRAFCRLKVEDGRKIVNFRQLYSLALDLLNQHGTPRCIQVVTDGADNLLFIRHLCRDLCWGRTAVISRAVEDAARMHAASAYLLVFTDTPRAHPSAYDRKTLRDYCLLMQQVNCTPREVLFMNGRDWISLGQTGQIPDMSPYIYSPVAEDEKDAPLVLDELILHSYPETDPF